MSLAKYCLCLCWHRHVVQRKHDKITGVLSGLLAATLGHTKITDRQTYAID